ncbi:hypothetical protein RFI_23517 [Reticulomyxa filosa]|uniref:Uncharacterized protein n=1 Tax=Reticulomyxa filosa TaxID=46433 RepID=X6MJM9_RETFI|nr:hypothetical protein RFI_23517 [Reticulomyxa filosa]|eukprot:ETO13851.1 hypothetical protein RFI_23517 [Reticulomyxa filosa]
MTHQYLTKVDPPLGELFTYEFVKLWLEHLQQNESLNKKSVIHLGRFAKQVIEHHFDQFVIFAGNKDYLQNALLSLEHFDGATLRPHLQQVLGVAKAFGTEKRFSFYGQILNGVNELLRGERQSLDLDLTCLVKTNTLGIADSAVWGFECFKSEEKKQERETPMTTKEDQDRTEDAGKQETMEKSPSPLRSISPIAKVDDMSTAATAATAATTATTAARFEAELELEEEELDHENDVSKAQGSESNLSKVKPSKSKSKHESIMAKEKTSNRNKLQPPPVKSIVVNNDDMIMHEQEKENSNKEKEKNKEKRDEKDNKDEEEEKQLIAIKPCPF